MCHSTMLRWPKNMMKLFEVTSVELRKKREEAENKLAYRKNMLTSNIDFCARKVKNLPLIQVGKESSTKLDLTNLSIIIDTIHLSLMIILFENWMLL